MLLPVFLVTHAVFKFNAWFCVHPSLQALNTLTQEGADDKQVEEDPETIRYSDRAPCEDMYSHCIHTAPIAYGTLNFEKSAATHTCDLP